MSLAFRNLGLIDHINFAHTCKSVWKSSGVVSYGKEQNEPNIIAWNKTCELPTKFQIDRFGIYHLDVYAFLSRQKCFLAVGHMSANHRKCIPPACIRVLLDANSFELYKFRHLEYAPLRNHLPATACLVNQRWEKWDGSVEEFADAGISQIFFSRVMIKLSQLIAIASDHRILDVGFVHCTFVVDCKFKRPVNPHCLRSAVLVGQHDRCLYTFINWCTPQFIIIRCKYELRLRHASCTYPYVESASWESAFARCGVRVDYFNLSAYRLCSPFVCHCFLSHPPSVRCIDAPWCERISCRTPKKCEDLLDMWPPA